ncbi:Fur family transcriptional regulator [Lachnospiraceae bacterium LCP25S3_G4]
MNKIKVDKKELHETRNYRQPGMQRELIIQKLKEKGYRITKQRLLILDIILENECSSCKEIYAEAAKKDKTIGTATVYRLVNTLEEIGAISRKNMYRVIYSDDYSLEQKCTVVLDDETTYSLSAQKWRSIVRAGLASCGYLENQKISSIIISG